MNLSFYLATIFIWGTTWIAIKFQLGVVAPEVSIAYRFGLAALLLTFYCLLRRYSLRFSWRQHLGMALQGLLLFSANYFLVYLASQYLASGLIAVVFSTIILMNIALNFVIFKKPAHQRVLFGALLGLIGIILVFWPEITGFDLSNSGSRGLLLAIISTAISSSGNITSAYNQSRGLPVVQTNAISMGYGTLILLVFGVLRGAHFGFDLSPAYVISLGYLALFGSVIAFGTYLTLIGRIGADRAAYVAILFPIIALAISTVYEKYHWQLPAIIGVALALLGNFFVLLQPQHVQLIKSRLRMPNSIVKFRSAKL
jgi:drug/metabolite transporter (DMT)-like permease